jgi:hypothetical protein
MNYTNFNDTYIDENIINSNDSLKFTQKSNYPKEMEILNNRNK